MMKSSRTIRNFLATAIVFLYTVAPSFAHKEWVHQYLLREAYNLLRNQLGQDVPELYRHIWFPGNGVYGQGGLFNNPWTATPALSIAIYQEDIWDAVWERHDDYLRWPIDDRPYASTSHFWDADDLKYQTDWCQYPAHNGPAILFSIGNGDLYPTAYRKANIFAFCNDFCQSEGGTLKGWNNFIAVQGDYVDTYRNQLGDRRYIHYNSLIDLYTTGKYMYNGGGGPGSIRYYLPKPEERTDMDFARTVAIHILGRIAHLLTDMSVPAHVHGDWHVCTQSDGDNFELEMGGNLSHSECNVERYAFRATQWDANTAADPNNITGGGLLLTAQELQSLPDATILRELFYSMNQLSDFFTSYKYVAPGSFRFPPWASNFFTSNNAFLQDRGNTRVASAFSMDVIDMNNTYTKIKQKYGDVLEKYNNASSTVADNGFYNMRGEVLMNYAIRATATLLYWFTIKAGLTIGPIPPLPFTVKIVEGAAELAASGCSYYRAQVEGDGNESPTIPYKWEIGREITPSNIVWEAPQIGTNQFNACMGSIEKALHVKVTATNPKGVEVIDEFIVDRYFPGKPHILSAAKSVSTVSTLSEGGKTTNSSNQRKADVLRSAARFFVDDLKPTTMQPLVKDAMTFNYTIPKPAAVQIDIFTAKHKKVFSTEKIKRQYGTHDQQIDMAALPEGAYIIQVMGVEEQEGITHRSFLPITVRRK